MMSQERGGFLEVPISQNAIDEKPPVFLIGEFEEQCSGIGGEFSAVESSPQWVWTWGLRKWRRRDTLCFRPLLVKKCCKLF